MRQLRRIMRLLIWPPFNRTPSGGCKHLSPELARRAHFKAGVGVVFIVVIEPGTDQAQRLVGIG